MNQLVKFILVIIPFLIFFPVLSQDFLSCYSDEINSEAYHNNPELQSRIKDATQELKEFTQNFTNQSLSSREDDIYIIPVVFHVIHDYGKGNISDAQIYNAIHQINTQFRKRNADTSNIVEAFKHLAADTKIEFHLAKLDPDGNCTNGITRTYSPLTNTGGHVVKDLIQWPPDKYVNIWVCNNVGPNLAGHCLMPGVADAMPEWDGIVIQHSYTGAIGTSNESKRTVLTHELGHYMNLYHIWGGNNVPEFYYLPVADPGNCDFDDEVADTPNTIGWQSCNLSGNTCGSLDMVQNYMDYSYCSNLFTIGQAERMHAALNSPIANRNNLWSESNLIATGLKDNTDELCKINFTTSNRVICKGESITFSDISYFGITGRNWEFEGGNITSSTDSSVVVTYNTPGLYGVQLTITDGINTLQIDSPNYIEVLNPETDKDYISETFEDENEFLNNWYLIPTENPTQFERTPYGKNSDYSIYVDNYNGIAKAEYSFQSYPIDAREYTKLAISFDFAYGKMSTSSNENLQILFSKDCGNSWSLKKKILLSNLFSAETDEAFYPNSNTEWHHEAAEIIIGNYNVEDLFVQILFEGNNGNNIFIDNINISDVSQLGIETETLENRLSIFPNPAKEVLTLSLSDEELNGEIEIRDISGKVVFTQTVKSVKEITINTSAISSGTYFLNYTPKDKSIVYRKKVIVL